MKKFILSIAGLTAGLCHASTLLIGRDDNAGKVTQVWVYTDKEGAHLGLRHEGGGGDCFLNVKVVTDAGLTFGDIILAARQPKAIIRCNLNRAGKTESITLLEDIQGNFFADQHGLK
jgi:hypothetical protein